ncbi:MAG: phage baseplate assembly protein V, partial [Polyangiaceae bacterium]
METLHELLTKSSRVINRHAGRMYGFVPAIVIADTDKDAKLKRHLRGFMQVYFPGLQDMGAELIAPWARLLSPAAGNMIDVKKTKKVKVKVLSFKLTSKSMKQIVLKPDPKREGMFTQELKDVNAQVAEPVEKEIEIEVPDPGPDPNSGAGFYAPPQKGDEVLCGFEQGDMSRPYIVGALWNGKDKVPMPQTTPKTEDSRPQGCPATPSMKGDSIPGDGGKNNVYFWRSRTGNCVSLDDKNGVVRVADRSGNSTFQMGKDKVEILQSSKDINLYASKIIRLDGEDISINAKKNILAVASSEISSKSGKDTNIVAGKKHFCSSKSSMTMKSSTELSWTSDTSMSVMAQGADLSVTSGTKSTYGSKSTTVELQSASNTSISSIKVSFEGPNGIAILSNGSININALVRLKFKGAKVLLNSGGSPPGAISFGGLIAGIIKTVVSDTVAGVIAAGKAVAGAAEAAVKEAGVVSN